MEVVRCAADEGKCFLVISRGQEKRSTIPVLRWIVELENEDESFFFVFPIQWW